MAQAAIPVPEQGVLALDGWEEPPRRPLAGPAAAPVLAVENFAGPLDWLLDLARSRRVDLARLSITALVDAFAAALSAALDAPDKEALLLARWSGWLAMAAELTLLRSRLLLPADATDGQAARNEAEQLRQSLLDRAATARAADWLHARPQSGRDVFPRGQADPAGLPWKQRSGDITALLRGCLAALTLPAEAEARFRVPEPPFWSVLDAARRIRSMLPGLDEAGQPLDGFLPPVPADGRDREARCRTAVSATFLAGLELARDGAAVLVQDETWCTIRVAHPGAAAEA